MKEIVVSFLNLFYSHKHWGLLRRTDNLKYCLFANMVRQRGVVAASMVLQDGLKRRLESTCNFGRNDPDTEIPEKVNRFLVRQWF